ncbi:MAG: rod shape-determining protein [Cyanobium sp. MAG06]|nr:rod shape-determining protein [Cyanobium sp. MAG06]
MLNKYINKMLSVIWQDLSNDIGIDLGTSNTLIYVNNHGIIVNEPTIVAINNKTERIVAFGNNAKVMLGKTPTHIRAVKPIVSGVISDYEITEEYITLLLNKVNQIVKGFFGARVVVGVPVGITNVEIRAVYDAIKSAGAREVYIIEEPMAAAIGIGLPVHDSHGSLVVDIGGGTTDIAVISLSGIVLSKSIKLAGDQLDKDIVNYLKNTYGLQIGENASESIKIELASVIPKMDEQEIIVKGRDTTTNLPKEIKINDTDVRKAIYGTISQISEAIQKVLESIPPAVLTDIMNNGIHLTGGGSKISGIAELLEHNLELSVRIHDEPLTSVAIGCGKVLEDLDKFQEVLIKDHEEIAYR